MAQVAQNKEVFLIKALHLCILEQIVISNKIMCKVSSNNMEEIISLKGLGTFKKIKPQINIISSNNNRIILL